MLKFESGSFELVFAGEWLEMNDGSHEFEFEAIWAVPA